MLDQTTPPSPQLFTLAEYYDFEGKNTANSGAESWLGDDILFELPALEQPDF